MKEPDYCSSSSDSVVSGEFPISTGFPVFDVLESTEAIMATGRVEAWPPLIIMYLFSFSYYLIMFK